MHLRTMTRFTSLGLALAAGAALHAQTTTGALVGAVRDLNGKPLPEVRVIISSPALFAPRTVFTDAAGQWRAPLLPVGEYKVQALKNGCITSEARNLRVGIGSSGRQDLVLKPMVEAGAVVDVVATNEEVDKADTKASTNFSNEILDTLAGADRSFNGAADLTAGVVTSSNGGFSMRGGGTNDTLYRVNGTDVKDDYQGAQVGNYVIEDNIADVQVVASPLNARNGRSLGGQINVVTKTGGNEFEGSIRAHLSRPSWGAANPFTTYTPGSVSDALSRSYDLTFAGPIVKDRLWFSVGTILAPGLSSSSALGPGNPLAQGPQRTGDPSIDNAVGQGPGAGYAFANQLTAYQPYTFTQKQSYFEGKLTGALNQDHTVEFSYTGSTLKNQNIDPTGGTVNRVQALGTSTEDRAAWGLNYRAVLGAATFLEAKYSRFTTTVHFPTGDPSFGGDPVDIWMDTTGSNPHTYLDTGYPFANGVSNHPDKRNSTSGNVNLSLFRDLGASHHELDLGMDYYQADRLTLSQVGADNRYFRAGGAYYDATTQQWAFPAIPWTGIGSFGQSGSGNTGLAPVMWQYIGQDGTTRNRDLSFYANDSMTFGAHWNAMAGLRGETSTVIDTTGATLAKTTDFSPRLQVRYDVGGNGHHVFTLSAARFQGDFNSGFTSAFITQANSKEVAYGFSGIPGQSAPTDATYGSNAGSLRWLTYQQLTNPAYYTKPYAYFDNSQNYALDPKLRAPYMDELTLTYRRSFDGGNFMRFTLVDRAWRKDWAFSTDYNQDPNNMVTIQDPTGTGLGSKQGIKVHVFNSNDLVRDYRALEVELLKHITSRLTLSGNYTYSRLTGDDNAGDNPYSTFRDNSVPGYYNNRQYLLGSPSQPGGGLGLTNNDIAPIGPLLSDQTQRVRLNLALDVPVDKGKLTFAALFRYDSGTNWSAAYGQPLGQNGYYTNLQGVPVFGSLQNIPGATPAPTTYTQYYGGRGQYTFNDTYQVDFKMSYRLPLGWKTAALIGDLQVNNVFNHMEQATYSTATAALPYGAPGFFLNTTPSATFGTAQPATGNYWIGGRSLGASFGFKF